MGDVSETHGNDAAECRGVVAITALGASGFYFSDRSGVGRIVRLLRPRSE